jgi:DNA-binding GntR family transcriptional regulator
MAAEGYISGASEAHIKIYETLMKCAHNKKLLQIYLANHIPLFHENIGKAMCTIDDHEQTNKEHRLIVKALRRKNLKLAEQTLAAHFAWVVSAVLDIDYKTELFQNPIRFTQLASSSCQGNGSINF